MVGFPQAEHLPSSAFLFCSGPEQMEWCPPSLVKVVGFFQCTNSTVNLFPGHTHRSTQIRLPAWASLSTVKLTKLTVTLSDPSFG